MQPDDGVISTPPQSEARLPDFVIIGAMKAGTTSLFSWLGEVPGVWIPKVKEPHFFSEDHSWRRGLGWYESLFAPAGPDRITGEASASYTHPDSSELAAKRMLDVMPDARLIFVARHPVDRMRSHYRHQVQRHRELLPFGDVSGNPEGPYAVRSHYYRCLRPYLETFPREQVLIIRFEDLIAGKEPGWRAALEHIGLSTDQPMPDEIYNVTAEKGQYTRLMLRLFESDRLPNVERLPRFVRKIGRWALIRSGPRYRSLLATSDGPIDPAVESAIWADIAQLESWLGLDEPLWARSP